MLDQPLSNTVIVILPQKRLLRYRHHAGAANAKPACDIDRNNPSIDTASLETLLQPTDMLVLFNDFIHADFFAYHPLAKDL